MIELGQMKNKEKTIEELEQELKKMKQIHMSLWETYGSELCSADMIRQEEKLEEKIKKLKGIDKPEFVEDPSQIIDD